MTNRFLLSILTIKSNYLLSVYKIMWNPENIGISLSKTEKDIVDSSITVMSQPDLISQAIKVDMKDKIEVIESTVTLHDTELQKLADTDLINTNSVVQWVLWRAMSLEEWVILAGKLTKAEKITYILSLYTIQQINRIIQGLFRVDEWDVKAWSNDYTIVYSPTWDPTAGSGAPAYQVASRATYAPDWRPNGEWGGFLKALTNGIANEIEMVPLVIEAVAVDDQIRNELSKLNAAVGVSHVDPELWEIISYYEEIVVGAKRQSLEVDRLPEMITKITLGLDKIKTQLWMTTPPSELMRIELEQRKAAFMQLAEAATQKYVVRSLVQANTVYNNTISIIEWSSTNKTFNQQHEDIKRVASSLALLSTYPLSGRQEIDINKLKILIWKISPSVGAVSSWLIKVYWLKSELIEKQNEIDLKNKNKPKWYRNEVKKLQKITNTYITDIHNLLNAAWYTIKNPYPWVADALTSDKWNEKTQKTWSRSRFDVVDNLDSKTKLENLDQTLTPEGEKYLASIMAINFEKEDDLNAAFGKLMPAGQLASLSHRYAAGYGPSAIANMMQEFQTMPPHHIKYVQKYMKLLADQWKSIWQKTTWQMKAEKRMLNDHIGTVRTWRRTWKTAKKMMKYNAKKLQRIQEAVANQLMSEYLEMMSKYGAQFSGYLSSYDLDQPLVKFNATKPNMDMLFEQIKTDQGEMWEALQFFWYTTPDALKGFLNKTPNSFSETVFANGLNPYGYPIDLPPRWIDNYSEDWAPTARMDEHGRRVTDWETSGNNYLIQEFWMTIWDRDANENVEYSNGYKTMFQEVGRRYLTGARWFDFVTLTEQLKIAKPWLVDLTWWDINSIANKYLSEAVTSLITPTVASSIEEQYVQYRWQAEWKTKQKMVSMYFVNALSQDPKLTAQWNPNYGREYMNNQLMTLRWGNWHKDPWNRWDHGNEIVWQRVLNFIRNEHTDETGIKWLGFWPKRPDESLWLSDHFYKPDGTRRGIKGTIDLATRELTTLLGVDPKHAPKVAAFTKLGLAAVVASYGWNFVSWYLLESESTFGTKLRRLFVTAWVATLAPRLFLNRELWDALNYAVKWWKDGEWAIKGEWSNLLKYFWYEWNPEEKNPNAYEHAKDVWRIFGELKIGTLSRYMTYNAWVMWIQPRYTMSDDQRKTFIANDSISDHAKKTFQIIYEMYGWDMDLISAHLDTWLVRSWLLHDKREEMSTDDRYKNMTISQLQMQRWKMEKFGDEILWGLFNEDPDTMNDIYFSYIALNKDIDAQRVFIERIKEIQAFETKRKWIMPYHSHVLTWRTDLYNEVWIDDDGNHAKLILGGLWNKSRYMTFMKQYINGEITTTDVVADRKNAFNDAYLWIFPSDPKISSYIKKFMLADDLKNTFHGLRATERDGKPFEETWNMRINTKEDWILWQSLKNVWWVLEWWFTDIPSYWWKDVMMKITAKWMLSMRVKWADEVWNEYELNSIWRLDMKENVRAMVHTKANGNVLKLSVKNIAWEAVRLEFNIAMLGKSASKLSVWETKYRVEKDWVEDVTPRPSGGSIWDEIRWVAGKLNDSLHVITDTAGLWAAHDAVDDAADSLADGLADGAAVVGDIAWDAVDIAWKAASILIPNPRMEWQPTWNKRPDQNR